MVRLSACWIGGTMSPTGRRTGTAFSVAWRKPASISVLLRRRESRCQAEKHAARAHDAHGLHVNIKNCGTPPADGFIKTPFPPHVNAFFQKKKIHPAHGGRGLSSPQQLDGLHQDVEHIPDNREDCHYLGGGGFVFHVYKPRPHSGIAARGGGENIADNFSMSTQ